MRGEDLERLLVAERDENLDTPLCVVVVLAELDLSEQTESCVTQQVSESREEVRGMENVPSNASLNLPLILVTRASRRGSQDSCIDARKGQ